MDDPTLSVNSGHYLERHLRAVIAEIENASPVELIAIGIGHDVRRYYRRAVTSIVDVEQLAGAIVEQLAELFDAVASRGRPPRALLTPTSAAAEHPRPSPIAARSARSTKPRARRSPINDGKRTAMRTELSIPTPDGDARAFAFHPEGRLLAGMAIMYMADAPAIRPALFDMAERLAGHGYYVLLPDMFWRAGPYAPMNPADLFAMEETARRQFFVSKMSSTDPERAMRDTGAFLDFLTRQPQVKPGKVGVFGYCMGGGLSLRAAGTFPDRVAAAGAFHGGRLATDEPDSPHLLAPKIKAKVYVAGADEDAGFPPEQADRLREALTAAGVDNEVTIRMRAHTTATPRRTCLEPITARASGTPCWRELLMLFD